MAESDSKNVYKKFIEDDFELLKLFKENAPGTVKHCQTVSQICSAISDELPTINGDMLKCASLYHDIGKIISPKMFIENQESDEKNPHDNFEPEVSFVIISKHISDGVALLIQYDFPQDVIKTVLQHHGNTIIKPFFDKSKEEGKLEDSFRYPWSNPESDEAVILMIVDHIEATAKSLFINGKLETPESKENVVNERIEMLTNDGQLDNVKVGILKVVKEVLIKQLKTIYHKRLEY